jgi:TonB family protein
MLKRPIPGARRMLLGASTALILTLSAGYAAWAAQPPPAEEVDEQATYNSLKPPKYPQAAIDAKAEGQVVLRVLVTATGEAEQVEIEQSSGAAELDQSAIDAVRKWKFNAARKGKAPAPAWVLVPIMFSLDGPPPEAAQAAPNTLDRIDISAG